MPAVSRPSPRIHLLVLLALSAAIGYINYSSYTRQVLDIESEARSSLARSATAAGDLLRSWRFERIGDATLARTTVRLMPSVGDFLRGGETPGLRDKVAGWLSGFRGSYQYTSAILLDRSATIRLSTGELLGPPRLYTELALEMLKSPDVRLVDVGPERGALRSHFVLGVALKSDTGETIGCLLAGVDPRSDLYPSTLDAHRFGRTGQVVLARTDGAGALFLSDGRVPGLAMTRHADPGSPAAQATHGAEGIVDGVDAAGVPALAFARRVGDSGWVVVAKMDADEVRAPIRAALVRVVVRALALFLVAAGGLAFVWRYQVSTFYRQQLHDARQRQALAGHYEHLTRFGNDSVLLLDDQGVIVDANDRTTDYLQYGRAELIGMNFRELRDPDALSDADETWQRLRERGRLVYETRQRRKDGSTFPVEVSSRVMDVDGRTFAQGIVRDITDRKQAEAQIRRVNRLYAVLSQCSVAIVDSRSERDLSSRVCQIAADVGGFRVASIFIADDAGQLQLVALAGEGAAFLEEVLASRPQGLDASGPMSVSARERRPVIVNDIASDPAMAARRERARRHGVRSLAALPLRRGDSVIGVVSLYSADVGFFNEAETRLAEEIAGEIAYALEALATDRQRRQAEEELRASRERLELALDATNEAVWDWDVVTGATEFSRRYETMLGLTPSEVRDQATWSAMIHPDDFAAYNGAVDGVLERGRDAYAVEFRVRARSGDYQWILSRGKVVARDTRGRPTRIVGTHTDVTERRKLEEQVRQSQKLESVGRLAGGIAHDFNNLLTVINGYSDVLLAQLQDHAESWKHVDAIRQAGERAAAMTHQLLAFSRKQTTQPRVLRLNAIVREFESLMRRLLTADIVLVTELAADDDRVLADPSQMHQVLMNLVVNARDAMPHGGTLRVATANVVIASGDGGAVAEETTGPCVRVDVSDTGTGMSPEVRAQVFEPFFTTKERGKGTGLGLSTVYGIVRQTGGFVRVESEVDRGTTFRVYLPRTEALAVESVAEPTTTVPALGGSETILVVEDLEPVRALAVDTLMARGFQVIAAGDGPSALQLASTHQGPIHVLLTDVIMPGMNGKTLAERLLTIRPDTKVILMSGYSDGVIESQKSVQVGLAYIDKPFTSAALVAKVREVLSPR